MKTLRSTVSLVGASDRRAARIITGMIVLGITIVPCQADEIAFDQSLRAKTGAQDSEIALVKVLARPTVPPPSWVPARNGEECRLRFARFASESAERTWKLFALERLLTIWRVAHYGHLPDPLGCHDTKLAISMWQSVLGKPVTGIISDEDLKELIQASQEFQQGKKPDFGQLLVGIDPATYAQAVSVPTPTTPATANAAMQPSTKSLFPSAGSALSPSKGRAATDVAAAGRVVNNADDKGTSVVGRDQADGMRPNTELTALRFGMSYGEIKGLVPGWCRWEGHTDLLCDEWNHPCRKMEKSIKDVEKDVSVYEARIESGKRTLEKLRATPQRPLYLRKGLDFTPSVEGVVAEQKRDVYARTQALDRLGELREQVASCETANANVPRLALMDFPVRGVRFVFSDGKLSKLRMQYVENLPAAKQALSQKFGAPDVREVTVTTPQERYVGTDIAPCGYTNSCGDFEPTYYVNYERVHQQRTESLSTWYASEMKIDQETDGVFQLTPTTGRGAGKVRSKR